MTNTKHDEEISELLTKLASYVGDYSDEIYVKSISTINSLISDNTKLSNENKKLKSDIEAYELYSKTYKNNLHEFVNENESLKNAIIKMDTDINNAHKDLVKISTLIDMDACGNIDEHRVYKAHALAKKYQD